MARMEESLGATHEKSKLHEVSPHVIWLAFSRTEIDFAILRKN